MIPPILKEARIQDLYLAVKLRYPREGINQVLMLSASLGVEAMLWLMMCQLCGSPDVSPRIMATCR